MRILYMIGGYGAEHLGGEIHRELALEIRSRGHDYGIFTLASSPGQASGDATEAGVPVHRAPRRAVASALDLAARPLAHCRYLVSTAHGLAAFLAAHPPFDVIVAEGAFPLGIACWWGARKRRVPYVVSVLGADFLGNETAEYGYARFRVPRALMRVAFTRAAVVRSISPYAAERAVALGCPPAKSAVVQRQIARGAYPPPGSSLGAFREEASRSVRERFGLGADGPLIVGVGRLLPIKGFEVLLHALPAVLARIPGVCLVVAGPDRRDPRGVSHRARLEAMARELGVADSLRLPGALTPRETRSLLGAADALAVPSLEEGGNKLIPEAAAVGTPVVATRTSGNASWAAAWGCALAVEPGSPSALASALVRVLSDRSLSREMAARGRPFAEAFRPERVATRLLALCQAAREGRLPPELRESSDLATSPADGGLVARS